MAVVEVQNDAPSADPLGWLSPAERYAHDYFVQRIRRGGSDTYPLAVEVQGSLFELYLRGRSLREIHTLNKGRYSLGQVVHAAVDGCWPARRAAVQDEMLAEAADAVRRAGAEATSYLADSIAAAARMQRDRVSEYLRTGDATGMPDLTNPATFLKLVEGLTKLTGADKVVRTQVSGTVDHRFVPPPPKDAGDPAQWLAAAAKTEMERKR